MKPIKRILCRIFRPLVLVFLLLLSSQATQAQAVVYDPAQFANMLKSIFTQSQQLAAAMKTLAEAKKIWDQTKRTKEELQGLHKLHRDVQQALKIARGIKDFKLSDLNNLTGRVLALSNDPSVYMPDLPYTDRLQNLLSASPSQATTRELYQLLAGLTSRSLPLDHYGHYLQRGQETRMRELALLEMSDQKKIQTALSYRQLADECIEQATELKEAVKQDGRLTMNESERIQALKSCQDLLMQSFGLKLQSDELLQSVARRSNQVQAATQQAYGNALFRKALAQTPPMKYGD